MSNLLTQFCGKCKTRKPIKGFDIGKGTCADCRKGAAAIPSSKKRGSKKQKKIRLQPDPRTSRCRVCLKKVKVTMDTLEPHKNARGETCADSGRQVPAQRSDALDHRIPGSFEGGKR